MRGFLLLLLTLMAMQPGLVTGFAWAVDPGERLADPALEARARALSQDLRCLVCRNENIDESDAPLAHDIRVLLRERLKAGDSDAQVLNYMRARYGDYVLLKPPVEWSTWGLWFGPPALLLIAGAAILWTSRRRPAAPKPLAPEEQARLDALLERRDG
ncbi:MAG TPA: cytochrome c-type biogenesis protein [Stellaceae bacterium]|jgi:cytochrome c-type biogenesis protein CcmH|nr:cytochrome c-type biogenesis protein [Stellaceae bacterium]